LIASHGARDHERVRVSVNSYRDLFEEEQVGAFEVFKKIYSWEIHELIYRRKKIFREHKKQTLV